MRGQKQENLKEKRYSSIFEEGEMEERYFKIQEIKNPTDKQKKSLVTLSELIERLDEIIYVGYEMDQCIEILVKGCE